MRRTRKWSASRITFELRADGIVIARRTVTKILRNLGLHRRRFIDPSGETNRKPQFIVAKRLGQMVHVDVKKVGKIPDGGGGWRAHGRDSDQAKRSRRRKTKKKQARVGYTYLHSVIDGNIRLTYTEARDNETVATANDFMHNARLFAAHGITRIGRVTTDNRSSYRAADFTASLREARH